MKLLSARGIDSRLWHILCDRHMLQDVEYVFGASKVYTPAPDPEHSMEPGSTNYVWYMMMNDGSRQKLTLFEYEYDDEYEYTQREWRTTDSSLPPPMLDDTYNDLLQEYGCTEEKDMSSVPWSVVSFDAHYTAFLACVQNGDKESAIIEFNKATEFLNITRRTYEHISLLEERYATMYQKLQELKRIA